MTVRIPAATLGVNGVLAQSCQIIHGLGSPYSRLRLHADTAGLTTLLKQLYLQEVD